MGRALIPPALVARDLLKRTGNGSPAISRRGSPSSTSVRRTGLMLRTPNESESPARLTADLLRTSSRRDVETPRPAPSLVRTRPQYGRAAPKENTHGEVPAAQALPRRSGSRRRLRTDGPVDAGGDRRARAVHARLRGQVGGHRRVRGRPGAVPAGNVRTVRRGGPAAGHRRPVRGDQGPDRRVDGDRRGDLRA